MTPKEPHENMVQTLAKDSLYNCGLWNLSELEDNTKSYRQRTSITDEQVSAIHRMHLDNRRLTVQRIATSIGIRSDSV